MQLTIALTCHTLNDLFVLIYNYFHTYYYLLCSNLFFVGGTHLDWSSAEAWILDLPSKRVLEMLFSCSGSDINFKTLKKTWSIGILIFIERESEVQEIPHNWPFLVFSLNLGIILTLILISNFVRFMQRYLKICSDEGN